MPFSELLPQLSIINVPIQGNEDAVKSWKGNDDLFVPETCARHLYVGFRSEIDKIPQHIVGLAKQRYGDNAILQGQEAYEFLLRIATGLDSGNAGEHHVSHQIRERWKNYKEEHPNAARKLQSLMDKLFEDTNLIRTYVLKDLKPVSPYISAKTLAGVGEDNEVVIFAGSEKDSVAAARALGKHSTDSVSAIHLTHPDNHMLVSTLKKAQEEIRQRRIRSDVQVITFENALGCCNEADHWFVCGKMGEAPETEEKIISAWKNRERSDGYLVHLNGDPNQSVSLPAMWANAADETFIFPRHIREHFANAQQAMKDTLEKAGNACKNCALSRSKDLRPERNAMAFPPEEYAKIGGRIVPHRDNKPSNTR
ncbi:MAG: hypothetical protein SFX19_05015 [Alphaproteobacteria bacterium]|nr:hypothetical protein [Alphaproteobacteria bacterium]